MLSNFVKFNVSEYDVFDKSAGEEISIRDLAALVAETGAAGGKPLDVQFKKSSDSDYLKDNPNRRCPDLAKTRAAVGYKPSVSLREGLERTLQSYKVSP